MSKTETTAETASDGPEDATTPEAREARELGAAGSQLSTVPREESVVGGPSLGPIGWIRWFWRQLTSMRVALILLFMLSLAAIPGSLIPQNSVDELKVQTFQEKHETVTPIYDKLQLFDVYSSVWFSAIYLLLFISLIGCIVPRTWQFVGQLRGRPPGAPKRLNRLPAYTTWRTTAEPEEAREAALTMLKRRRFRAHTVGDAVAAEKGYLRETGNLLFHIALIVMLVAFATGQLFKSEGGKLIMEGDGFSNTLTQYDDFKSGSMYDTDDLEPFSFSLDKFIGTFERNGPQVGTAREFEAHVSYSTDAGGKERKAVIEVNEPLEVNGSKVYLIGHGYAPVITVRDGAGKVVFKGATPLLPIDNNITSTGAIKVMDGYRDKDGKKQQLGFNAFFVPTFAGKGNGNMFSQFPELDFPDAGAHRLQGQPRRRLRSAAERVPARHQQDEAVQGRRRQQARAAAAARRDDEAAGRRGLGDLREGHQGVGDLPGLAAARQRARPRRRDRGRPRTHRLALHPAAADLGPRGARRRRGHRRGDGRPRSQRVGEAPRGTGRSGPDAQRRGADGARAGARAGASVRRRSARSRGRHIRRRDRHHNRRACRRG